MNYIHQAKIAQNSIDQPVCDAIRKLKQSGDVICSAVAIFTSDSTWCDLPCSGYIY